MSRLFRKPRPVAKRPVVESFAPAYVLPYAGGRIPDVNPVITFCRETGSGHEWGKDLGGVYCLACDVLRPPLAPRWSQAGVMSVRGAR